MLLHDISSPADLRTLSRQQLEQLASEVREFIVETVTETGGHLGSNLGAVELTLAVHRAFESPRDVILWDTGHQAYAHKLVTGRLDRFKTLRQPGGLSGYPSRRESPHDWIENSHASTALSYAQGFAKAFDLSGEHDRHVVAVVGDGSLTGGMAYEALNNLGHAQSKVIIVLNDNGRSYAPTVSKLSSGLTHLRLNPSYVHARERGRRLLSKVPGVGGLLYSSVHGMTSALREIVTPHRFFEILGIRYVGPFDGHDIARMEEAFVKATAWDGPILVHVLTQKGRGYAPAEEDDIQRLHDYKVRPSLTVDDGLEPATDEVAQPESSHVARGDGSQVATVAPATYTDAFTRAILEQARKRSDVFAITAAMPGPTGLLPFEAEFPERFLDVGIAEQHAATMAAGLAMAGLRPVVAVYSTFFSRCFDQANLDVSLHGLGVVFVLDRAGITGDDGPSHHGLLDMSLMLSIPGMTVFAPSCAEEVAVMLDQALKTNGPCAIRFPKTPARHSPGGTTGSGLSARLVRRGDGSVCMLAVGKMVEAAEEAASKLAPEGIDATVWDVRVVSAPDEAMLADAASHCLVVTVEDGIAIGGAGGFLAEAMRSATGSHSPVPPVRVLGIPRSYIAHGKPDAILSNLGLDGPGIAASIKEALAAERERALEHRRSVSPSD